LLEKTVNNSLFCKKQPKNKKIDKVFSKKLIWKRKFFRYTIQNFNHILKMKKTYLQQIITNILILILWYFVYTQSNLNNNETIIITILGIITINFLFSKNKIIKIINIPFIILIWFFIILGFAPLYQTQPNNENFHLTQHIKYFFSGQPQQNEITEITNFWEKKIKPTNQYQELFFEETDEKILTIQNNQQKSWKIIITFPDNTIYILYNWQLKITKTWQNYNLEKIFWESKYYQPNNNKVNINDLNNIETKDKSDFEFWYIIKDFEKKQKDYTIKQWWWIIIMEPFYQRFSKNIIDIAYKIRPEKYQNNQDNYQKYKEILWRNYIQKTYKSDWNYINIIIEQINKARKENRIIK
jgi:hypothetical protein